MLNFENILFFYSLKALNFKLVEAKYPIFSYAGLQKLIIKMDRFFFINGL